MPSVEKSPVRESDAPTVIGALVLGLELLAPLVGPLLVLLLLLQAATTPADRTVAALKARQFLESQGRWGLTPGASFLLVRISRIRYRRCRAHQRLPRAR